MTAAIAEPLEIVVEPSNAYAILRAASGRRFRVSCAAGDRVQRFGDHMRHHRVLLIGGETGHESRTMERQLGGEFRNGYVDGKERWCPVPSGSVSFRGSTPADAIALRRMGFEECFD